MNHHFNFEWEFRDFKIRTNHEDEDDKDSPVNRKYPIELIKYDDDAHTTHYSVAWWRLNEDGYSLVFRGDVPFYSITPEEMASIWVQLGAAQKMLDEYYNACYDESQLEYW